MNEHRLFLTLSRTLDYFSGNAEDRELVILQCNAGGLLANDFITLVKTEVCSISSLSVFIIWSIIYPTTVGKTHGRLY